MPAINVTTLRDLSRAYAVGALDRETYRRQRHDLLTRIVADQMAVEPYQAPEPEQRTVFPYDDDEGDTTQEILTPLPPTRLTSRPTRRGLPWLAIVGVLVLGGAAAAYYFTRPADKVAPATPAATAKVAAADDPLTEFLNTNQWNGPQLQALGARWNALSETQRASLRGAPSMRRLTDKAFEQIQAENALITLGDAEEALGTQQHLLDLLEHLGVDDARLPRARDAWRSASAEFAGQRAASAEQKAASTAASALTAEPVAVAAPSPAATPPETTPTPLTVPSPAPTPPAAVAASGARPEPAAAPATPAPAASLVAATAPNVSAAAPQSKPARGTCKASLAKTRRPYCQDALAGIGKGPALVVVPAGEFEMGGEAEEEQPRHAVKFQQPFAIGLFEVSAAEFALFCNATNTACPAQPWSNPALPVVNVSWAAANAYVQWLSKNSGASYRLPTEAEWEYAARAGSTTPYPFGTEILPTHARYSFKATETSPLPAGDRSVNRNDFKLYHMLGNVREWVADAWRPNHGGASADGGAQSGGDGRHVVRGGSYADRASALRSAARLPLAATGDAFTGFRVVRVVE